MQRCDATLVGAARIGCLDALTEEQAQRCTLLAGAARDDCLAAVSVASPGAAAWVCDREVQGGCRRQAAPVLMTICRDLFDAADPQRLLCVTDVATTFRSAPSCDLTDIREACLLIVAVESRDASAITGFIADPRMRDIFLAQYAASARDASAIDLIESDDAHDYAVISLGAYIATDRKQLDTFHCAQMRAGEEVGDVDQNPFDRVTCRKLTAMAVQLAEQIDARLEQAESRKEKERVLAQLIEAVRSGEISNRVDLDQIPDPGNVRAVP